MNWKITFFINATIAKHNGGKFKSAGRRRRTIIGGVSNHQGFSADESMPPLGIQRRLKLG